MIPQAEPIEYRTAFGSQSEPLDNSRFFLLNGKKEYDRFVEDIARRKTGI